MPRGSKVTKTTAETRPATPREIREWATAQGLTVATKGRLAKSVVEQFTATTGRQAEVAA